ncbi:TetR/AcrR family transcriptional regulator [Agrobacterium sp. BA1120]|uniref:TetR/AcrR family transcriptional regulator n=1 Tax=Agrobacterium sp. BA1120 TaxID=3228927 RepID=UPI00336AB6A3
MTEQLFRARGFGAVSIADIAAALSMSPANVFKHFHSKNALVDAIFLQQIRLLEQKLDPLDASHPPFERLRHLARSLMENHRRDLNDNPYIFEMILMTAKRELACGRHYENVITGLLANIISDGIKAGIYAETDVEKSALTALYALTGILHPALIAHEDIDILATRCDELTRLVDAALRNGIDK